MLTARAFRVLLAVVLAGCARTDSVAHARTRRFKVSIPAQLVAVLPKSAASGVFRQCSRAVPGKHEGTWTPSAPDLAALRETLVDRVSAALDSIYAPGSPMDLAWRGRVSEYGVQVVGITRGTERILYANGFLSGTLQDWPHPDEWTKTPVVVCDGGEGYFGAIFDPASGIVSDLVFNGRG